jgi:hypothetical protein
MFIQKEGSSMKTSSKVYFVLGALATIGTMSLMYCAIQDTDKSPKQLLRDSKKFVTRTLHRGDHLVKETSDSIMDEAHSLADDANKII